MKPKTSTPERMSVSMVAEADANDRGVTDHDFFRFLIFLFFYFGKLIDQAEVVSPRRFNRRVKSRPSSGRNIDVAVRWPTLRRQICT